jgi:hypothetical protein
MVNIASREELKGWLEDKPADWAAVIAVRAALRGMPFLAAAMKNADQRENLIFCTIWPMPPMSPPYGQAQQAIANGWNRNEEMNRHPAS